MKLLKNIWISSKILTNSFNMAILFWIRIEKLYLKIAIFKIFSLVLITVIIANNIKIIIIIKIIFLEIIIVITKKLKKFY